MQGLKTQETEKFEKFMELVQAEAEKEGKIFFLDAGDGNEFETDDLEGEDLTGWLIPPSKVKSFEPLWEEDEVGDDWTEFYVFAVWRKENKKIVISFEAS